MKKPLILLICLFVILPGAVSQLNFSVNTKYLQRYAKKKYKEYTISEIKTSDKPSSTLNGKFFSIKGKTSTNIAYVGRVYSCKSNGCGMNGSNSGQAEYFDYYVVFNHKKEVVKISIFNYQATHGHAVSAKSWLKQFYGYNGNKQLIIGNEIDAVSGATISANAFTKDIQKVCERLISIK